MRIRSFILHALLPTVLMAQVPQARLDTTVIRIGEQATLTLQLDYRSDAAPVSVQWPVVGDTLTRHVEVVRNGPVDTIASSEGSDRAAHTMVQRITVTAFDSGYWAIPPFRFVVDGRSLETPPLLLEVRTVPLDSAQALRDIKDIIEPPFSLLFWAQDHALFIVGAVVLVALALLLLWWYKRRTPATPVQEQGSTVPLHERVLAQLRALESERLWQQGLHKAYHSRLTDLLRGYIEERYGVPALERTTDELLQELRVSPLPNEQQTRLANMLRLADTVKFAKAIPAQAENEQVLAGAIALVQDTATSPSPNSTAATSHAHG